MLLSFFSQIVNKFLIYSRPLNGQFDEALAAYQKATTIEPLNTSAWLALGQFLVGRGQTADAQAAFKHAAAEYPRDPSLQQQFELKVLPLLSTANVRDMLAAALPLPQMTSELSQQFVTQHLVNRARSTRSRRKKSRKPLDST